MKRWLIVCSVALGGCIADAQASDPELCGTEVPELDWDGFGEGFVTTYCQGCHASTALDRHGAPAAVTFDSEEETLAFRDRILARAASEEPTMPPAGGPDVDDRELLAVWLACAP
jgi:uncharacterized membrane protein